MGIALHRGSASVILNTVESTARRHCAQLLASPTGCARPQANASAYQAGVAPTVPFLCAKVAARATGAALARSFAFANEDGQARTARTRHTMESSRICHAHRTVAAPTGSASTELARANPATRASHASRAANAAALATDVALPRGFAPARAAGRGHRARSRIALEAAPATANASRLAPASVRPAGAASTAQRLGVRRIARATELVRPRRRSIAMASRLASATQVGRDPLVIGQLAQGSAVDVLGTATAPRPGSANATQAGKATTAPSLHAPVVALCTVHAWVPVSATAFSVGRASTAQRRCAR